MAVHASWKQQRIKAVEEVKNLYFYDRGTQNISYKQVALRQVTGSTYFGAYVGWTWQEMRNRPKRDFVTETNCDELIDNPKANGVDEVLYEQFGDEYFISNGQHRTCIAKFMGRESVFVQVHEHPFDNGLFTLFQQLQQHGISVELTPFPQLSSLSKPIWQLSVKGTVVTIYGRHDIASFLAYYEHLKPTMLEKVSLRLNKSFVPADWSMHWNPDKVSSDLRKALLQYKTRGLR